MDCVDSGLGSVDKIATISWELLCVNSMMGRSGVLDWLLQVFRTGTLPYFSPAGPVSGSDGQLSPVHPNQSSLI